MSKYGETHDIFNQHHLDTKAKLDSILAKNTQIEVNNDGVEALITAGNASHASINGKITACDTGAVVVSSSALPAGAASESSLSALNGKVTAVDTGAVVVSSSALPAGAADSAKQDEIKTLITATNTALAGTLTVSSSGASLSKSSSTPISAQSINGQSTHTSAEIDVSSARHISVIANSSDTVSSHEVDILVSNVSGGSYFESSHSGYFLDGNFHMLVADIPYEYIKIRIKNGDTGIASATFTAHLLTSN